MLAAPFQIAATQSIGVTDQFGTRTVTLAAQWYRTFLASSSGTGTEANPREWLDYLADRLNTASGGLNPWSVTLTDAGLVRIAYSGTGTATITWDGTSSTSTTTRNLCGFSANVSITSATTATATYYPTHCALSFARPDDTDYGARPALMVVAELENGTTDAITDHYQIIPREFTVRFAPATWDEHNTAGAIGTPMWPQRTVALASQWTRPTPSVSVAPPYSWHQFVAHAAGRRVAIAFDLQAHIAATATIYDCVCLAAKTLTDPQVRLSVANWAALKDRASFGFTLVDREARS